MDGITVILFLCICVPIIPIITLMPDRRARQFLGFLLIGVALCLVASELNSLLFKLVGGDTVYVTSNITPITEELLKCLPVLYFALCFSDDRQTLVSLAMAVGLGFAMLESMVILVANVGTVTIPWALARGFGAAQMHGACSAMLGLGVSFVYRRRKLFWCGTFSLLLAASVFHAIFNLLVQSDRRSLAFVWSALLFVPQIVSRIRRIGAR